MIHTQRWLLHPSTNLDLSFKISSCASTYSCTNLTASASRDQEHVAVTTRSITFLYWSSHFRVGSADWHHIPMYDRVNLRWVVSDGKNWAGTRRVPLSPGRMIASGRTKRTGNSSECLAAHLCLTAPEKNVRSELIIDIRPA